MSTPALVLHLTGHPEPLLFALSEGGAKSLTKRLDKLLTSGAVDTPELADGSTVAINFGHVATAHLEELPPNSNVYGSPARVAGLGRR